MKLFGILLLFLLASFVLLPYYWHWHNMKIIESAVGPMHSDKDWKVLAEKGDKTAQHEQCSTYAFKKNVDTDFLPKLSSWCRKSAEEGDLAAEFFLANLYATGQGGLTQDWKEAYFWYAARIINKQSPTTERDESAKHLTVNEINIVNKRVEKWKENLCASNPSERNAKVVRDWHCIVVN